MKLANEVNDLFEFGLYDDEIESKPRTPKGKQFARLFLPKSKNKKGNDLILAIQTGVGGMQVHYRYYMVKEGDATENDMIKLGKSIGSKPASEMKDWVRNRFSGGAGNFKKMVNIAWDKSRDYVKKSNLKQLPARVEKDYNL